MGRRTPWIVTYDGSDRKHKYLEMACLRCGESYVPTLPVPVDMYVAMSRAFIASHRSCRETSAP